MIAPFNPFLCKLIRAVVWLAEATKGVGSDVPITHAQFTCKHNVPFFAWNGLGSRCLWNPCEFLIWWLITLGGISSNLFLSRSIVTVSYGGVASFSWHVIFRKILLTGTVSEAEVFSSYYTNAGSGAIASTWPTWLSLNSLMKPLPLIP